MRDGTEALAVLVARRCGEVASARRGLVAAEEALAVARGRAALAIESLAAAEALCITADARYEGLALDGGRAGAFTAASVAVDKARSRRDVVAAVVVDERVRVRGEEDRVAGAREATRSALAGRQAAEAGLARAEETARRVAEKRSDDELEDHSHSRFTAQ